jgi:hypothetical protein
MARLVGKVAQGHQALSSLGQAQPGSHLAGQHIAAKRLTQHIARPVEIGVARELRIGGGDESQQGRVGEQRSQHPAGAVAAVA